MDLDTAFKTYAAAFERSFAADDWKFVQDLLAADAIWIVHGGPPPLGGAHQGSSAVIGAIRESCNRFDRRFDSREPRLVDGPHSFPGGVYFTWKVIYRRDGLPAFVLEGEEWDSFHDGKLELHRERLWNSGDALRYLDAHDGALRPVAR
jgi:hypothetical protein